MSYRFPATNGHRAWQLISIPNGGNSWSLCETNDMLEIIMLVALLTGAPIQEAPPTPAPAVTPLDFTEIGRTKASTPACAALRELVAPSFDAAIRADKQFGEAAGNFSQYAVARVDATTLPTNVIRSNGKQLATRLVAPDPGTATPESLLARLDSELGIMQKDVLKIAAALGDPRLAEERVDPVIVTERQQLQNLYEVELARINSMTMFLQKENLRLTKQRLAEEECSVKGPECDVHATPPAVPNVTGQPFDQPSLTFNAMNDKQSIANWTGGLAAETHKVENAAARTFLAVGESCRKPQ
jgi:hypothetical protein